MRPSPAGCRGTPSPASVPVHSRAGTPSQVGRQDRQRQGPSALALKSLVGSQDAASSFPAPSKSLQGVAASPGFCKTPYAEAACASSATACQLWPQQASHQSIVPDKATLAGHCQLRVAILSGGKGQVLQAARHAERGSLLPAALYRLPGLLSFGRWRVCSGRLLLPHCDIATGCCHSQHSSKLDGSPHHLHRNLVRTVCRTLGTCHDKQLHRTLIRALGSAWKLLTCCQDLSEDTWM